jgi:hypothetical protein
LLPSLYETGECESFGCEFLSPLFSAHAGSREL